MKDVARVEIGSETYMFKSQLDGVPSVAISLNTLSGANAIQAMKAVRAELNRLSQFYPDDFTIEVFYDATEYIAISFCKIGAQLLFRRLPFRFHCLQLLP